MNASDIPRYIYFRNQNQNSTGIINTSKAVDWIKYITVVYGFF